tara:strand:+ start:515 stop:991 length:477 start_codon:yes stop_codon:yes gene_type:complete
MITKDNLISAYFIDNERQNIEVLTRSEDGTKVIPTIIPFDENNHLYKELISIITVDKLHEDTYNKKKQEQKDFEAMAMRIAKKTGLVLDKSKIETKFYPEVLNAIFNDEENEEHLFALKLALFELDKIRDSKDDESKKKLRQSKNKIDVLKIAIDLMS